MGCSSSILSLTSVKHCREARGAQLNFKKPAGGRQQQHSLNQAKEQFLCSSWRAAGRKRCSFLAWSCWCPLTCSSLGTGASCHCYRVLGAWLNHPRKKTWVPNAQRLILEAPVSKSAAGTAFLVGCFGIAGARQNLEAKQTLF